MAGLTELRHVALSVRSIAAALEEDVDPSAVAELAHEVANTLEQVLEEPTNVQALALARLLRDRPGKSANVTPNFDLPAGYWFVTFNDGFECGIAPNGDVSS
jgi:hypothetical protein